MRPRAIWGQVTDCRPTVARPRERGGPAISLNPRRAHRPPLCRSLPARALPLRQPARRPGVPAAIRCSVPRTYRTTRAPGVTRRPPGQPARSAAATGAPTRTAAGTQGRHLLVTIGQVLLRWAAAVLRRLGDRLLVMNDTEACWRGWHTAKTHGGLARRSRDPRFDMLAECARCQGPGCGDDLPCVRCAGTGRITCAVGGVR